jgi:hypothetical protein
MHGCLLEEADKTIDLNAMLRKWKRATLAVYLHNLLLVTTVMGNLGISNRGKDNSQQRPNWISRLKDKSRIAFHQSEQSEFDTENRDTRHMTLKGRPFRKSLMNFQFNKNYVDSFQQLRVRLFNVTASLPNRLSEVP